MRIPLGLALSMLIASAAMAQATTDRYGYRRTTDSILSSGPPASEPQEGRRLTWANKVSPSEASSPGRVAPSLQRAAYEPYAPQSPYQAASSRAPTTYQDQPSQLGADQRFAVPPPASRAQDDQSHDATSPHAERRRSLAASPRIVDPAPDVPPLAGGPPPRESRTASNPGGSQVRYYSLHRGYGLTPDAIPEPQRNTPYVLVGPADPAPSANDPARQREADSDDVSTLSDKPS